MSRRIRLVLPGRTDYRRCYALQRQLVDEVVADPDAPGALIVTEHSPTITCGRASRREHVLAADAELERRGVQLVDTDRGGDVTWHGPGQVVLYPVVRLDEFGGRDLGRFLRALEECAIRALARFGIRGRRVEGMSGVWTESGKVCALGAAFRRWVSYHGVALNVDPDMSFCGMIVPCGLHGERVTSMREILGADCPDRATVERALIGEFCALFGVEDVVEAELPLPPPREPLAGRRRRTARRHPPWLVKRLPAAGESSSARVGRLLDGLELNTVCRSANCPNLGECFARGTATFLIMGPNCTRGCRFCSVSKGAPQPLDRGEPARLAEAAARLGLGHVVVTSVTRDDLPDGGAAHFAAVVGALREAVPGATVELLVPDFGGRRESLRAVMDARPDVLNHNVETVPRLYPLVRPGADYRRSLELLAEAKRMCPEAVTKSGLMVGLGESRGEVTAVLGDLASAGATAVTVGQYLAPTAGHLPVAEYVRPEAFREYARAARAAGIAAAACGPWVRSSYRAEGTMAAARTGGVED
ncbi:MAG: lipoyl synthase [Planctomycetota bacterium]|jgi:lipoic acid synthetase